MTEKIITQKDVEYVAKLARIHISPDEVTRYQEQLERILGYVGKLKEKDTRSVKPTSHPHAITNVWREDEPKPFGAREELLKNAPEREETFFKVKKVIE